MTGEWSTTNELLATLAEIAFESYRTHLAVGGVKAHKLPKQLKIPRPQGIQDTPTSATKRPDGRRHAASVGEVLAVINRGFGPVRR